MSETMELPISDDGPDEDVDIELTEDELGGLADVQAPIEDNPEDEPAAEPEVGAETVEAAAAADDLPKPKKQGRGDKRIAELSRRALDAEERAKASEAQLASEAALRRQSDAAMMTHYESSLRAQAAEARRKLLDAKAIGDSEAEVDAQTALFKAQADLNGVQAWKTQQGVPVTETPRAEPAREEPRAPVTPSLDPGSVAWIKKNEWFRPDSPNFDAEMHEEATLYARRVERRFKAEGRGEEIGGDDYFREIDTHIRSEFPDAFEGEVAPKRGTPPMTGRSPVAPVTRTGIPGQAAKPTTTVKLTPDHRRMAHNMAANGAYKNPDGSRMTNEQAEKYYAIYLMKQNRR